MDGGDGPADATDRRGATPLGWRVAAGTLLIGGAALGYAASDRRLGKVVPLLSAGVALGCAIPIAIASRRPPISPERAAAALAVALDPPTFTVLVGARDEATVLPQLVRDVAGQDYRRAGAGDASGGVLGRAGSTAGEPLFELIVVDDRSTDGGGGLALAEAERTGIAPWTQVIRREGESLPEGKGAALTAAQPHVCRGQVVVVLDADARIDPGFLRHAAGYFAAGAPAVTARRRILDAGSGLLAGAQADEQTLDGELNRGRWSMGGCSEFRGNGIMIRTDLLARVGGWRAAALTEDIDLSSRVAAATGNSVAWAIDAEVWEEPVRTADGLLRQRFRWAEGALRRAFEHGPAVVRSRSLRPAAKLDFAAYVGQLAVPAIGLGAAAAATRGRRSTLVALAAGYLGIGGLLGWDSLRWQRGAGGRPLPAGERLRRAARVSLFGAVWLIAVPRALAGMAFGRGDIRYHKMPHQGSAEAERE